MATFEDIPTDLALEIGEDLDPKKFIAAAKHFFGLVSSVSNLDADDKKVSWRVKVREGSNILAMHPSKNYETYDLGNIYNRVNNVTLALSTGDLENVGLNDDILEHAKGLSDLSNIAGESVPIKIWVRKQPTLISPEIADFIREERNKGYTDYGSIEGQLNAIQDSMGRLELKIKDQLYPRAIRCIVPENMLPNAMNNFRNRIEVYGDIHYRRNGTPESIDVTSLEKLPDDSDLPSISEMTGFLLTGANG